ncbi:MAG: hypothetical protein ACREFR_08295, partial [Limisphaerales bacterium]
GMSIATSTTTFEAPAVLSAVATAVETSDLTPAPSTARLSVAARPAQRTAPAPGRPDPRLGLVDRAQAEHEARAKAMWGDTKEQIISYLMIQGFNLSEANELAAKLSRERAGAIRDKGIRKIITGTGMMCVPIIALLFFLHIGIIPTKLFALTVMVGLAGLWLFVNGLLMAIAPKSERGSVAD